MNDNGEARQIAESVLSGMIQQLQFDPRLSKQLPAILVELKGVIEEVLEKFSTSPANKEETEKQIEHNKEIIKAKERVIQDKANSYVETVSNSGVVVIDKRGKR